MRIDWWTLGLQTINALVLIWLLSRFLFKPVAAMIAERQAEAVRIGADADAIKAEAARQKEALDAAEAQIAAHRAERIKAATEAAAGEKQRLLDAAHAEADQLLASGRETIARERQDEEKRTADRARALGLAIAGRLLARLPDSLLVEPFLPGLASAIASLPPEARAGLAENPRIRTARAVTDAERAALTAFVGQQLGTKADLQWEVEPAVIAGVEIEGAHAVASNSLRTDLNHVAAELAHDGG